MSLNAMCASLSPESLDWADASRLPSGELFEQLRCAPVACVLVDGFGCILDCNNALSAMFLRSSESLTHRAATSLVLPDDEALFLSALHQVLNTGYSDTIDVHTIGDRRVQLSLHWVDWDEGHHPCCLITVNSDSDREDDEAPPVSGPEIRSPMNPDAGDSPPMSAVIWFPIEEYGGAA